MEEGIRQALTSYAKPKTWKELQYQGMRMDFSWHRSARQYARIYRSLVFDS